MHQGVKVWKSRAWKDNVSEMEDMEGMEWGYGRLTDWAADIAKS